MNTPLRLDNYFFPVVQIVANSEYRIIEEQQEPIFKIHPPLVAKNENGLHQVSVEISLLQEEEKSPVPYSIHLVAFGLFAVQPDWPEPEKLLFVNGATILYAAAREFLITISSRGPWGAVTLPMVSFLKMHQDMKEKQNSSVSEDENEGPGNQAEK